MGQKEINYVEQLILIVLGVVIFIWWFNSSSSDKSLGEYIRETAQAVTKYKMPKFVSPQPKKRVNKKEEMCREILERNLGMEFPTVRPDWLMNPETGKPLELDCYNSSIKLALEYDGEQHYKYVSLFHKSPDDLAKQVERDALKDRMCRQMGITLVRVPYWIDEKELEGYILRTVKEALGSRVNDTPQAYP